MRLPANKLLVILRGSKPLLLDKMYYKKHPLASKLKDSSIYDYNPKWTKNSVNKPVIVTKKDTPKPEIQPEVQKEGLGFHNF